MINKYKKEFRIDSSKIDNNAKLRFDHIFELFEIMITDYLGILNKDNITLKNKYDSAWVIAKSKLEIYNLPSWNDNVYIEICIVNNNSIKIDLEITIYDMNNNILVIGLDEMCPINLKTRRIIRLRDIEFNDIPKYENKIELGYLKADYAFKELCNSINVNYIDIDFTNHCNNISYIRYIINELGIEFFKDNSIKNATIHYLCESKLNDKLDIYKNKTSNNIRYLIKKEESNIFFIDINY